MRRAVDTFITLCDKQKIGIDFDDYQLFEIIQGNMSIGAVPPDKKTLSHHKKDIWIKLNERLNLEVDKASTKYFPHFVMKEIEKNNEVKCD